MKPTQQSLKDQLDSLDSEGKFKYQLGKYDEALKRFDKAVSLSPNEPKYLNNRAAVKLALGNVNQAKKDLLQACRLDPTNPLHLVGLVNMASSEQDYQTTLELLDDGISRTEIKVKSLQELRREIQLKKRNSEGEGEELIKPIQSEKYLERSGKHNDKPKKSAREHLDQEKQALGVSIFIGKELVTDGTQKMVLEHDKQIRQLLERDRQQRARSESNEKQIGRIKSLFQTKFIVKNNLVYMRIHSPYQHIYVTHLSHLLFSTCQAFNLAETDIIQAQDPTQQHISKPILDALGIAVSYVPIFGPLGQLLCKGIQYPIDWKNQTKINQTKQRICRLTKDYIGDRLGDAILKAVIDLSYHPYKRQERSSVVKGQQKSYNGFWGGVTQWTKNFFSKYQEMEKILFNVDIPSASRVELLAIKDFSIFLKVLFDGNLEKQQSIKDAIQTWIMPQQSKPLERKSNVQRAKQPLPNPNHNYNQYYNYYCQPNRNPNPNRNPTPNPNPSHNPILPNPSPSTLMYIEK